jgi:hypothetical protein
MRFLKLYAAVLSLVVVPLAIISLLTPGVAKAQNIISGEITGTVTDAMGAVVPRATVTLISADSGAKTVTTTSASGGYRFPLLQPGTYKVTATATGFGTVTEEVKVDLGQVSAANIKLVVSGRTETVQVTEATELIHAESADLAATVDEKQVQLLPNSGNDLTNYALTTPGVVLSTGGGYGNFTSNGIGGMSNLFTINGNDYNDPYLNLNNSGSSNMLLGQNEVQEVSVVTNGYTAQYGRMAGTNMNMTTKSGTNSFHGDANWTWNGTVVNANDWFNTPAHESAGATGFAPHAVSNQWSGDVGGPIIKNKLFGYYDNEGIRYVLPSGGPVFIPSPQFETAVNANIGVMSPASLALYKTAFAVYNGASGYAQAQPVASSYDPLLGCGDIYNNHTDAAGNVILDSSNLSTLTLGTPCALVFQDSVNNLNIERFQSIRVDWNLTDKDKLNFRYKGDRGVQATSTDPINSAFSANSVQPSDEGQMSWTRVLNNTMVNQFIASDLHYVALFGPPNIGAAEAVFPTSWAFGDGLFNALGNYFPYPEGRVVEQYQFVDDFTWTKGSHGIKFGVNYRRNDISSHTGSSETTGEITENSMTSFADGTVTPIQIAAGPPAVLTAGGDMVQAFTKAPDVPVALFSLGLYIQDEWRVNPKLKLTYGLRFDMNSDEVCQKTCFSRPNSGFVTMNHTATTPYNASVLAVKTAFPGLEFGVFGPRGGFDWTPLGPKTVIRGGIGLFSDLYPGLLGDRAITNLPNYAVFTITSGAVSPAAAGSVWTQASASNTAFQNGFSSGGTLGSIQAAVAAAGSTFTTPGLTTFASNVKNPKYLKYNLQIEQSIGDKTAVTVNYAGNHGYDLFLTNRTMNSYCSVANCANGFEGLPAVAPDTRFANVREYDNGGYANYNGLTATITQRVAWGFTGSLNYTWSHTLDELYEGGIEPLNALSNPSFTVVIDPSNIPKYNYASADQDVRQLMTANFYWEIPVHTGDADFNQFVGGWVLSGTFQHTTGTPFSAYYTSIDTGLLSNATSARVLAQMNVKGTGSCGRPNANSPCFTASQFQLHKAASGGNPAVPYQMAWGGGYNMRRNNFTGPGYFDSDISLLKNIRVSEKGVVFSFGATAINFFNHPNFDRPVGSVSSGSVGQIIQTVGQPNSPYGNFQGSAADGRIIESQLKVKF